MSSHREAPEISKDPVADSSDLYAFVSPDAPDTVTIIANYVPLQLPGRRPELLRVRRRRAVRDPRRQRRRRPARPDVPVPVHAPSCATPTRSCTTPGRSSRWTTRTGTGGSSSRSPRSTTRQRHRAGAEAALPALQRRHAVDPQLRPLAADAVAQAEDRREGLRRAARRRVLRRPRRHLRPRHAAPVREHAPASARPCSTTPARRSTPPTSSTCTASPSRCRSRPGTPRRHQRSARARPGAVIGVWTSASRRQVQVRNDDGKARRPRGRPLRPGLAARQPAVQRGHRADGAEGPVEQPAAAATTSGSPSFVSQPELADAAAGALPGPVPQPGQARQGRDAPRRPAGDPAHRHPGRTDRPLPEQHRRRSRPTCCGSTPRSRRPRTGERVRRGRRRPGRLPQRPPDRRRRRVDLAAGDRRRDLPAGRRRPSSRTPRPARSSRA